jgi:hypothetical protein
LLYVFIPSSIVHALLLWLMLWLLAALAKCTIRLVVVVSFAAAVGPMPMMWCCCRWWLRRVLPFSVVVVVVGFWHFIHLQHCCCPGQSPNHCWWLK